MSELNHRDVCIFCMSGIKSNCPWLTVPPGTLKDFIVEEFGDPIRAARRVICGVIAGAMLGFLIFGLMSAF